METLNKYRIWCVTESTEVIVWNTETPVQCPNDSSHIIDQNSIAIIESVKDLPPHDPMGKPIIRAESRPWGYQTTFTMQGDGTEIGNGKEIFWDFSNDDDIIDSTSVDGTTTIQVVPIGYKCKRIKIKFADAIYIKEGTIYFHNALKKSYINFSIICPVGNYYYNRNNNPVLATDDTVIIKYLNKHFFCGTCPMGDELNTESCNESPMPSNYELWVEIYVPEEDNSSYGYGEIELYRMRSCLLPGEEL